MNQTPDDERSDRSAVTRPLPVVRPQPPYAPIFGNVASYAFARLAALAVDLAVVPAIFACFVFTAADRGTLPFAPRTPDGFAWIALCAWAAALVLAIVSESVCETTLGKALFALGVRHGTGRTPVRSGSSCGTCCCRSICSRSGRSSRS